MSLIFKKSKFWKQIVLSHYKKESFYKDAQTFMLNIKYRLNFSSFLKNGLLIIKKAIQVSYDFLKT